MYVYMIIYIYTDTHAHAHLLYTIWCLVGLLFISREQFRLQPSRLWKKNQRAKLLFWPLHPPTPFIDPIPEASGSIEILPLIHLHCNSLSSHRSICNYHRSISLPLEIQMKRRERKGEEEQYRETKIREVKNAARSSICCLSVTARSISFEL